VPGGMQVHIFAQRPAAILYSCANATWDTAKTNRERAIRGRWARSQDQKTLALRELTQK
jgi:hypothetical protein